MRLYAGRRADKEGRNEPHPRRNRGGWMNEPPAMGLTQKPALTFEVILQRVERAPSRQQFGGKHTLGRFRLALTTSPRPLKLKEELPAQIAAIVSAAADKRTGPQKQQLAAYFRSLDPDHARLSQGLASYARCAGQKRMIGAQDLVWALINSPAFLFNR